MAPLSVDTGAHAVLVIQIKPVGDRADHEFIDNAVHR